MSKLSIRAQAAEAALDVYLTCTDNVSNDPGLDVAALMTDLMQYLYETREVNTDNRIKEIMEKATTDYLDID